MGFGESGGSVATWVSDLGGALEVGGYCGSCRGGGSVVGGGWDLFALSMLSIFSDSFCSAISIFLILESSSILSRVALILFSSMLALISVMSFLRKLMKF